jgi:hypothetical protein
MITTRHRTAPTTTPAAPPTTVEDMPPLHVTKAGIPTDEHLPVHVPQSVIDEQVFHRRARIVIAVITVLCLVIGVATAVAYSRSQPPSQTRAASAPTPTTLISPFTNASLAGVIDF